jgi:uncharacterized protein (DUF2132 family)
MKKIDRTQMVIYGEINHEYLSNVVIEAINTNEFKTDNINLKKDVLKGAVVTKIVDDLRRKYGKNSLNQRLSFNPYAVIKEGFDMAKKTELVKSNKEIEEIDNKTHKKTGNMIYETQSMIRGKRFYQNVIKGAKLDEKFRKIANIGIYGEHLSIKYDNFIQSIGQVERTVDGHTQTGIVSKYIGRTRDKDVYIIEWSSPKDDSSSDIEVMNGLTFRAKYPQFDGDNTQIRQKAQKIADEESMKKMRKYRKII